MTHSLSEITCGKCKSQFTGVLQDVFNIEKQYAATCPSCTEEVFFNPGVGIIGTEIPNNAVPIKYVAKL